MLTPTRVAGTVVLYHPGPEVVENVRSWSGQVEIIFVVDNSEDEASEVLAPISVMEKVVLIRNGRNEGVARALNIGAEKAVAGGYDYLLTMDQDSSAAPDMVEKMLACPGESGGGRVGMLSPFHVTTPEGAPPVGVASQEVMTPMTSGCLLYLAAFAEVGPFREDFFIDFVDNEYCLRLRRHGFRVLRANEALLRHRVGDTRKFGPFIATNHSPLRRYYKTRNRFRVFCDYFRDFPGHCLFDMIRLAKEIGSILLFEQDKFAKLEMMWRGWCDFRRGKFGNYDDRA
jgi:rhamnosyltransferase